MPGCSALHCKFVSNIYEIFVTDRLALDFNPSIFLFQVIFTLKTCSFSLPKILSKLIGSGYDLAKKIRIEVYKKYNTYLKTI